MKTDGDMDGRLRRCFEGTLPPEEKEGLREALRRDPDARRRLVREAMLRAEIRSWALDQLPPAPPAGTEPPRPPSPGFWSSPFTLGLLVGGVLLALSFGVFHAWEAATAPEGADARGTALVEAPPPPPAAPVQPAWEPTLPPATPPAPAPAPEALPKEEPPPAPAPAARHVPGWMRAGGNSVVLGDFSANTTSSRPHPETLPGQTGPPVLPLPPGEGPQPRQPPPRAVPEDFVLDTAVMGTVQVLSGNAFIFVAGLGAERAVAEVVEVRDGHGLRVPAGGQARLQLKDGTAIVLEGGTVLAQVRDLAQRMAQGECYLDMTAGRLRVEERPAGRTGKILVNTATAQAVSSRGVYALAVNAYRSRLVVDKGPVDFIGKVSSTMLTVPSGHHAVADDLGILDMAPTKRKPDGDRKGRP